MQISGNLRLCFDDFDWLIDEYYHLYLLARKKVSNSTLHLLLGTGMDMHYNLDNN